MSANYTGCVDAAGPLPGSNAYENFLGYYVPSNEKPATPEVASTLESISCANGEELFTRSWDYFQNGGPTRGGEREFTLRHYTTQKAARHTSQVP